MRRMVGESPAICAPVTRIEHSLGRSFRVVVNIDHTRTEARSSQANGICERFDKTVLNEFCKVAFFTGPLLVVAR